MNYRNYIAEQLINLRFQFDIVETPVYKIVIECCDKNRYAYTVEVAEIYPDIFNPKLDGSNDIDFLVLFKVRGGKYDTYQSGFLGINHILYELKEFGAPRINSTHINKLELSVRTYNALTREDIYYVEDIIQLFENGSILEIRNLGKKSVAELCDVLNKIGFEVKNPFDEKKRSSETEEIINKLATKMNVSPDEVSSMLDDLNVQGFRRKKVKEG